MVAIVGDAGGVLERSCSWQWQADDGKMRSVGDGTDGGLPGGTEEVEGGSGGWVFERIRGLMSGVGRGRWGSRFGAGGG